MKHLWIYRLSDDDSYYIFGETYLTVPMTEALAVRDLKRALQLSERVSYLTGTLYRIDESVGLPASKPTRTFWRSPDGKVFDTAKKPRSTFLAREVMGIHRLLLHKPFGTPTVLVVSNVTGAVLGSVDQDGVRDEGRLPAEVVARAQELLATGSNL